MAGENKQELDQAFADAHSSPAGLSDEEAAKRLERVGRNVIEERRTNPLVSFLSKFAHPFTIMIEVAIILSIVLGNWPDVALISFLLFLNVSVDFVQERKAASVIESLRKRMAVNARVLRDGKWKTVGADVLVPGDVVLARGGNIVPADTVLVRGETLELDESALTGESLPVTRGVGERAFSSSRVNRGEMQALVTGTGKNTFFGKTATLAEEKQATSHFEKGITRIGEYIVGVAAVCIAIIIAVSSVQRHESFGDVLLLVLTLAVASIPAALPAVLTVVMSTGARHLADDDMLVRRLAAIEELAAADILCTDKTGTLTTGRLEMEKPDLFNDVAAADLLEMALLCSDYPASSDPIDNAIAAGAKKLGFDPERTGGWKRTDYTPADSVSKRAAAVVSRNGTTRRVIKGAPQVVLAAARASREDSERYGREVEDLARRGFRSIGVAFKDSPPFDQDSGMTLAGVLPLRDPPREESEATVSEAGRLGITVKMMTGDHEAAAAEVASEVGIGGGLATADEVSSWSDEEFERKASEYSTFAQVLPETKYRIVEAFQNEGHIVGMTGDGVNDSPALKKADVGIAVEGATDVARAASDVILTGPGLRVIINGLREGKIVFARMKNYVIYRISETIRIILFVTFAIGFFALTPIGPHQIVLLAILNDIPILAIAGDNAEAASKPESWGMPRLVLMGTLLGAVGLVTSIGLFLIVHQYYYLPKTGTLGQLQTAMFLKLAVGGHMTFFVARRTGHWWSRPHPSRSLLTAVLSTMALSTLLCLVGLGSLLPRISWLLVVMVWGWSFVWMQVLDYIKVSVYRYLDRRRERKVSGKAGRVPPVVAAGAAGQ